MPGTLINFIGVRRIRSRGIKAANKFMMGAAIAYNIKKWLKYKAPKIKTGIMVLTKATEGLCIILLCNHYSLVAITVKSK